MMLTLVGLGMILVGGSQTALAHGWGHHGYHARYAPGVYNRSYWGPRYPAYYGGGFVGGYSACGPGYAGYGAVPYGYAYPQPGLGVAGRNFSFWLQP
jgi:hypothetical protein